MKFFMKLFIALHVAVFRLTKGRLGSTMGGHKVLLLTTTGAKTGRPRTVPVMIFEDGGRRMVIASAAGSPVHPAWYKNLMKTAMVTVELPGQSYPARAETLSSAERAVVWPRLVAAMPNFGEYEKKTAGREIPVVELRPV